MVCLFCRKRKIKCDMKMPCSACVKFKAECDYSEFAKNQVPKHEGDGMMITKPLLSPGGNQDEMHLLKERLLALEETVKRSAGKRRSQVIQSLPELNVGAEGQIDFDVPVKVPEPRYSRQLKHWGPFRWVVLVSLDPVLFGMVKTAFKQNTNLSQVKTAPTATLTVSTGLFGGTPLESLTHLRQQIQGILPNVKVVWMLIGRFFAVVYPYIPVLDEIYIREMVKLMIGPETMSEKPTQLSAGGELDFANLGILLMMLRFAYLTIHDCNRRINASTAFSPESMHYLAQYDISEEFARLAQKCLGQYNLIDESIFDVVQLVGLLCLYNNVNPESWNSDNANRTLFAVLNQMAYCRRLNREPHCFAPQDDSSPRWNMLCRKMWYTYLHLDLSDSIFSGNCVSINPDTYDVSVPTYHAQSSNARDHEMEKVVLKTLEVNEEMNRLLVGGLAMTGKLTGSVSLKSVREKLSEVEEFLAKVHEQIRSALRHDPLSEVDSFHRNSLLTVLLKVQFFIFNVNTHIYYNHLKRKDYGLATSTETKLITSTMQNVIPLLPMLLGHVKNPFSGSTDLFSISLFVSSTVNIPFLLVSLLIKYKSQYALMKCNNNHSGRMRADPRYSNLFEALEKYILTLDQLMLIFGNFYSLLRSSNALCKKLDYGHRKLHEMVATVEGSAEDKAYIRTSTLFLEGCNQIIREGIDRVEFSSLRQKQEPLPVPNHLNSPTDLFDNRMFESLDFTVDELLDIPMLENIL